MTDVVKTKILNRLRAIPRTKIIEMRDVVLTARILETLYERHTNTPGHELYWEAIKDDLLGKTVTAGIVSGEHVLGAIVVATGTSTKPSECSAGSIRFDFGINVRPVPCGKLRYWKNVIHRAKKPEEVLRDIRLFFPDFQMRS